MRIVHITGYFQPTIGYEEYYVSKNQIEMGHESIVLTSDRYYPYPHYNMIYRDILGDRLSPPIGIGKEKGVLTIRLPSIFEMDTSIFLKWMKKTINSLKPDIIHFHELLRPLTLQGLISFSKNDNKIIVDVHMHPIYDFSNPFIDTLKTLYIRFHKTILFNLMKRKINGIYATKEKGAFFLKENYNLDVPVIPLGVDTELFNSNRFNISELREKFGFRENDFILFYSGKFLPRKGLEDLIRIFNHLSKKYDLGLLMVGDGPSTYVSALLEKIKPKFHQKAKIHNFTKHFLLPKYMSVANLGCWLGEIPSASINEFLGIGRPVLVKTFEGRNLEKKGFRFAREHVNIQSSINWIENLINNESLYKSICINARKYAITSLDWKFTTKQILKLYDIC